MPRIIEADRFIAWLEHLSDARARDRIVVRLRRLAMGNPGDVRPIGGGLSELRINHGPGYRVYYLTRGTTLVVVLGGGTKQSQDRDIREALRLAALY